MLLMAQAYLSIQNLALKSTKFLLKSLMMQLHERMYRSAQDKTGPIRAILEMCIQNILSPYSVEQDIIIDEIMALFRRKCPFR